MHQVIALSVTLVLSLLSFTDHFQRYYWGGQWLEALGALSVPIALFYAINLSIYLVVLVLMKVTRQKGWLAPFRSTKIHYFGLACSVLLFMGAMAMRGAKLAQQAG